MIILEQGAPKMIKRSMEQRQIVKRSMEQEEKLKRSREHRKIRKKQGKSEKGARGKKMKGAGSKGGNCERSKEHGPPLTEAHHYSCYCSLECNSLAAMSSKWTLW